MGYEVREENVVKNGIEFLGISIIDSDRYMIPVFYVEDIITKAEQSGATVKEIVRDMLKIHNDALRESEELNKPIHFIANGFLNLFSESSLIFRVCVHLSIAGFIPVTRV